MSSEIKPLLPGKTSYRIGQRLMEYYPTTGRLIENQINNDQNNHRHTQQPAYEISTYIHDVSPQKYFYNSYFFIDFGLHSSLLSQDIMM